MPEDGWLESPTEGYHPCSTSGTRTLALLILYGGEVLVVGRLFNCSGTSREPPA